jgi:predicted RNA-binding Zn-ribbon protein involved in translation (DUF1610 family)
MKLKCISCDAWIDSLNPKAMCDDCGDTIIRLVKAERIRHNSIKDPSVSDNFQIGPEGAYEHEDTVKEVNRFEVIDENGRSYVKYDCALELSYQDDGKTLKIFITKRK